MKDVEAIPASAAVMDRQAILETQLAELRQRHRALDEEIAAIAEAFGGREAEAFYADSTHNVYLTPPDPELDPDHRFQLWIVDGSRDTNIENTNRIDGGVFDVTAEGEVIVPIDAKLLARDAAAFAITVESPGGVVESKGPLQLVAVVEKS